MVIVRPRMAKIGQQAPPRVINFLHPAYPDGGNILLQLYAVDDDGIDFDFAHIACSIIANNAFANGWLAQRRAGGDKHEYEAVTRRLLKDESYYFCVGEDASYAYPITTRIDDWEFPHHIWDGDRADDNTRPIATWTRFHMTGQGGEDNAEPLLGATSDPKVLVRARDKNCLVTECSEATEVAHLVPRFLSAWFSRNRMSRYCRNPIPLGAHPAIDDNRNGVLLRRDLHWLFDASRFVFAPKSQEDGGPPVFLAHVLQPGITAELLQLYHNLALRPLRSISIPFVFVRLALGIFKNNIPVSNWDEEQTCYVRVFDSATSQYQLKIMTQRMITAYKTQSRSIGSSKRSSVAEEEADGFSCNNEGNSDGEASWATSGSDSTSESESNDEDDDGFYRRHRGWPRKRAYDIYPEPSKRPSLLFLTTPISTVDREIQAEALCHVDKGAQHSNKRVRTTHDSNNNGLLQQEGMEHNSC